MAAAPFVTNASDIVETKNIHRILLLKHAPFCETFHLYKVKLKKNSNITSARLYMLAINTNGRNCVGELYFWEISNLTLRTRPLNASHDLKDYLKDPVAQIAKYNN